MRFVLSTPVYDTIVVGLGAIGSAAVYQLSKRGMRVRVTSPLSVDKVPPATRDEGG
jgi:phosphoglycerate dehydrogenase-like enzyme